MYSFDKRKDQLDVHKFMRRIIDTSTPVPSAVDQRWEGRSLRAMPVLICPVQDGTPIVDEATFALTENLSSDGVSIVLPSELAAYRVVVGFWVESRVELVLGQVKRQAPLGGGFWRLGVQLLEQANRGSFPAWNELSTLVKQLDPEAAAFGQAAS